VFELDLGREPDIRDWPDAELEYLKQQFKDDEVHVEISDKREIEAAPHTNGSEPTPSKSSQKRNRVENRLRDRLKQTIGMCKLLHISLPLNITSKNSFSANFVLP
jgi:sulfite reductase alpha subunit-like flavoprotein